MGIYISQIKSKFHRMKRRINLKQKHIVSFSGGKDSTTMLLKMIENNMQVDKIIFGDTGVEFQELYDYIEKIEKYINMKIIRIKSQITWDDWFYKPFSRGKNKGKLHGFPFVLGNGCWAKRELKIKPLNSIEKSSDIIYLGIAADEKHRLERKQYNPNKYKFPLVS